LMAFMAKPAKLNLWSTESSIGKWSSNPDLWRTKSSTYVITFYSSPNTFCTAIIKDVVLFLYPYITLVNRSTCFSKSKAIHFLENLASGTWRKTELRSKFVIYLEPWKRCNSSLICDFNPVWSPLSIHTPSIYAYPKRFMFPKHNVKTIYIL
jgi:hypothetical protein